MVKAGYSPVGDVEMGTSSTAYAPDGTAANPVVAVPLQRQSSRENLPKGGPLGTTSHWYISEEDKFQVRRESYYCLLPRILLFANNPHQLPLPPPLDHSHSHSHHLPQGKPRRVHEVGLHQESVLVAHLPDAPHRPDLCRLHVRVESLARSRRPSPLSALAATAFNTTPLHHHHHRRRHAAILKRDTSFAILCVDSHHQVHRRTSSVVRHQRVRRDVGGHHPYIHHPVRSAGTQGVWLVLSRGLGVYGPLYSTHTVLVYHHSPLPWSMIIPISTGPVPGQYLASCRLHLLRKYHDRHRLRDLPRDWIRRYHS